MLSAIEVAETQRALQAGCCSECGSRELVTDRDTGEVLCSRCGLVLSDTILDQKPEWRAFTPEERRTKARTGPPTNLNRFDKGLSTTFQPYKDSYGRALPMRERLKMMRLRKWNIRARVHSSVERNLSKAMSELTRLSDKLRIPRAVAENAALIYRKALDEGLIRGRSIKSLAAASLYAACRLTQIPRSLKMIVEASTRSRRDISRNYRLLQRELHLKMPIDDPIKFIPKIASNAELDQRTQNLAIELLHKAKKRNVVVGKGPAGIAAAALYIAAFMNGKNVTQRKLAKASGVTEVTVRNRYKGLDKSLGLGIRRTRK
jgi:transcription initiation factor TFIIB